jgi:hypothetical protein
MGVRKNTQIALALLFTITMYQSQVNCAPINLALIHHPLENREETDSQESNQNAHYDRNNDDTGE